MPRIDSLVPSEFTRDEKKLKVEFVGPNGPGEFALDCAYYPAALNTDDEDLPDLDSGEGEVSAEQRLAMGRRIVGIYARWDLEGPANARIVDDNGRAHFVEVVGPGPVPLEPAVVAKLPFWLQSGLLQAAYRNESEAKPARRRR